MLADTRNVLSLSKCHTRVGGYPAFAQKTWIPAFAGMTPLLTIFLG